MEQAEFSNNDIQTMNEWAGYLSFKPNFVIKALKDCDASIILVDKGNQMGGTTSIVKDYIDRILGVHPIEKKNIRPNTPIRIIRFASETLPNEASPGGEIKNTIYPQFMKFFPHYLIKKDITARRPAVTIRDPQGGADIITEYVSYNQELQAQAGVQRFSVFLDEQSPKAFFEEQIPRLIAANGDLIIGLTPAEEITWLYEDIYQKAGIFYYSPAIIEYLKKAYGENHIPKEIVNPKSNIAVIRAATDDNPTLDKDAIEDKMSKYDDRATMEIRRYGIFHQMSGVIYKEFTEMIHKISGNEYFPDGVPHDWVHSRGIDFHEHTNWACVWMALSNWNEAFIYHEYNPSPDRMVTLQISREIATMSRDYRYPLNLIDPWAAKTQVNTNLSVVDDINRAFYQYKKEGIGTGGYWQTWDTKSARGRDIVKERLKNSLLVGKPFNNRVYDKTGGVHYLPTLWILDHCKETIMSFKNWRWEQWASKEQLITKDEKNTPQDRHSHFPVTVECIFKHPAFSVGRFREVFVKERQSPYEQSFRART